RLDTGDCPAAVIARIAPTLRNALALVVIPLAAVAGVIALRASGAGTTISAYDIMLRASHSYDGLAATLGPNTTLHEIDITHDTIDEHNAVPFESPEDYRTDSWWAFDGDGAAKIVESKEVAADGTVYSYTTWDGTETTSVDARFDTVVRRPFGAATAQQLAAAIRAIKTPDLSKYGRVTVTASTFEGVAVYVVDLIDDAGLSRSYVDRRTFHELRSEDIAPGPHGPTVTQ